MENQANAIDRAAVEGALPKLQQSALLPERYSKRSRLVTWLKRVDHVEIRESVKRGGTKFYVVDVYMKLSRSHIPTNRLRHLRSATRRGTGYKKPDVSTERRFSEFTRLLSDFYYLAHSGHGFVPCAYCAGFVNLVIVGKTVPSTLDKLLCKDVVMCELLTRYVNELLDTARRVKTYGDHCTCPGKDLAPAMMKEFLTGISPSDDDENAELSN